MYTFAALARWMAQCLLVGILAAGFVVGPEFANFAWLHGTHVTPEQADLHRALTAQGITHHHNAGALGKSASRPDDAQSGNLVESTSGGISVGTMLSQLTTDPPSFHIFAVGVTFGTSLPKLPSIHIMDPLTPPPEFPAVVS